MNSMDRRAIFNIQVLRGVASIFVVFFHLSGFLTPFALRPVGLGGVDLFFVISGFIMVYATRGRAVGPVAFMKSRVARIVPLYWLVTFVAYGVAVALPSLVHGTTGDPIQLVKSLFFIPFLKNGGMIHPVLFVGWTLNYEMFFYTIFALGLFFRRPWMGVASTCAALGGLVLWGYLTKPTETIAHFLTDPIMIEFAFGMLIALFFDAPPSAVGRTPKGLAAVSVAAGLVFVATSSSYLPSAPRLLASGVPAGVIVAGAVLLEKWGVVARLPFLLILGDASYSIYLTHMFVVNLFAKVEDRLSMNPYLSLGFLVITFAVACLVGIFVYRVVERPLSSAARRLLGREAPGQVIGAVP
jgi:exopolysaccharide production protein ExoZ